MTVRRLDENGDIVTSGVQFIRDLDEILQTVKTRLRLYLGEYWRDITEGTPWFETILVKFTSLDVVESVLKIRISQTPGVIALASFKLDFDNIERKLTIQADIITNYGLSTVVVNG